MIEYGVKRLNYCRELWQYLEALFMATKLLGGVGAAIGCRFLPKRNQLIFVEYNKGAVSLLDMIRSSSVLSSGTTILKGTWVFDCETGTLSGNLNGPGDIWWEQLDKVKRQMVPAGGANIVNLGNINFAAMTPVALQALTYGKTSIIGNNDSSNQLLNNDVFAVQTKDGNVAKIRVVQYDYNMTIEWVTYKLASPYHIIGTGYTNPEDIAVSSDEKTAYITERTGNLLRVDLANANRQSSSVLASGLVAPQQVFLDEFHQQAYIVEYANPGRLIRVDLNTHQKTVLLNGLNNAVGLLVSSDLAHAYISEQSGGGRITRYPLQVGVPITLATGLTNPFFLTWLDSAQTTIILPEGDPANRITLVDTVPYPGSVRHLTDTVGVRPSSVACIDAMRILVCSDQEIDLINILGGFINSGLFKGIGLVPWNLITPTGKVDTTTQPLYPYQFAKDVPFGGALSLQINQLLSWQSGVRYYRVFVDDALRFDTWWDLKLNIINGKYEIPVQFVPNVINGHPGYFAIHQLGDFFMNTDLGMILDSASLANGLHTFKIDFTNAAGVVLHTQSLKVLVDNNKCFASIDLPTVAGVAANQCGMLKFNNKTNFVQIVYMASHPTLMADFSFGIIKGPSGIYSTSGTVAVAPFIYKDTVSNLLGTCPSAAFAVRLYVAARAINGISRQSQYDASRTIAFALTP